MIACYIIMNFKAENINKEINLKMYTYANNKATNRYLWK